ncbi:Hypothetical predicted protein [Octopus vulgaris]|uniref:Reverse transcriptase domain-containing protein n=1 Tax=Octopus vulgaris TaxID=6645 RepID=A0AA36BAK6_OCTVU|nr:Hypothetical predicted protein [Octopus vulgaris]
MVGRHVIQEFKDAAIQHLYENKGNRSVCDNRRGISLLSIAGKILARLVLDRIIKHVVNDIYPESQYGYRSDRGNIDMLFPPPPTGHGEYFVHLDYVSQFAIDVNILKDGKNTAADKLSRSSVNALLVCFYQFRINSTDHSLEYFTETMKDF